jgi:predicted XRE-type DNA-binding protein
MGDLTTQAKAATLLRVTQPRVNNLLRGRLDLFSTDTLIDMLARLGVHVRFVLKAFRRRLNVA